MNNKIYGITKEGKNIVRHLDNKVDVKRKYKLIVEETYIYEYDNPEEIEKIIDNYVNYT